MKIMLVLKIEVYVNMSEISKDVGLLEILNLIM